MMPKIFQYCEKLHLDEAILYFNGPVSQSVVEGLADLIREKMLAEKAGMASVQRVFSILVEQMQNIVRYSSEHRLFLDRGEREMAQGQVIVGREKDGHFFVACGNRVRVEDVRRLAGQLEILKGMNKKELKVYYKERRRGFFVSSSKGAGLGLIEMARKSARPMDFSIVPLDCDTSFFSMKVVT